MVKTLRLAGKIGGGFVAVLVLTVIISVLAITSVVRLGAESEVNNQTSKVLENMQNGTLAGKNFVIYSDRKYIDTVAENMDSIVKITSSLKESSNDKERIQYFEAIIKGAEDYKKFFTQYADFEGQLITLEASLTKTYNDLDSQIASLYQEQVADFGNLVRSRASVGDFDDKSEKMDGSSAMRASLFKSKIITDLYIKTGDPKLLESLDVEVEAVISGANSLLPKFAQQKNIDLIRKVITEATAYQQIAKDYIGVEIKQKEAQGLAAAGGAETVKQAGLVSNSIAEAMDALMSTTIGLVSICSLFAVIIGIILSIVITRIITKPIAVAVDMAGQIAGGELRKDIPDAFRTRGDEIGDLARSLQDMVEKLRQVIGEVSSAVLQVSSGSQQLSSTSQEMSQGATEQASSVEEISSSMEQMTANIRQNADNALQTEKIAQKSAKGAEEGGQAVSATVNAMKEIASKIGIIEEIARSTNMLALNASIEAARAGEYGKGFAVVASEVGKLAERSQKEAGEISTLSTESVAIAEGAGVAIAALIPEIRRTAELVQEISASSNEQNSGATQINAAIMQLDSVVQQNASASEESASMSEELASQAEQMQATMEYFKIDGAGAHVHALTRKAAPAPVAAKAIPGPAPKAAGAKNGASGAKASPSKTESSGKAMSDKGRLPLTGIHLDLDGDSQPKGKDELDGDFQEF